MKELFSTINLSRDKRVSIKARNAFYFGDEEEFRELVNHTGLRQLHFSRV